MGRTSPTHGGLTFDLTWHRSVSALTGTSGVRNHDPLSHVGREVDSVDLVNLEAWLFSSFLSLGPGTKSAKVSTAIGDVLVLGIR